MPGTVGTKRNSSTHVIILQNYKLSLRKAKEINQEVHLVIDEARISMHSYLNPIPSRKPLLEKGQDF